MCGIIGYQGRAEATEILLSALSNLEYRGYDSAGIALWEAGKLKILKRAGRLQQLKELVYCQSHESCCGFGHTRWATHGVPSEENAHPHQQGRVTLVHNGIIENYGGLKKELAQKGYAFMTQTDTEVAAALVDACYDGDPLKAIREATRQMTGAYAFVIAFEDRPDQLYGIRRGSPLITAYDENGCYLASDLPAILSYTQDYLLLEEEEIAVLEGGRLTVLDSSLEEVKRPFLKASWSLESAQKEQFEYFMLKEIAEQPKAIANTLSPRIQNGLPDFSAELPLELLKNAKKITITACGTALYAGTVGKTVIEQLLRVPVELDIASELRYRNPVTVDGELAMIISQSGETADSLAALRLFKERKIPVIALVNVVGSSIAREADYTLYTYAGPEIAVASTKAYSVQVALLTLLALYGSSLSPAEKAEQTKALMAVCEAVRQVAEEQQPFMAYGERLKSATDLFYIGRGLDYALALEGSLKLKEISYIHSEAYAAGELKHGTISLITEGVPVVAIATQGYLLHKTLSNMQEVRARGGKVLLITMEGLEIPEDCCDEQIVLPKTAELYAPLVVAVAVQSIAAHAAIARGNDVDKPRNLAKSVTVE